MKSIHGEAFKKGEVYAAVCTDCHGSHDLHSPNNPESRIYKFNVPKTCSKCHENVFNTYKMSVHAKALYAGVKDSPVCTDCHGEHTIHSHTEPASSVYPSSIVKTCAHCHASEKITTKYGLPADVLPTYMQSYHGTAYQYGSLTAANCASCHGFHDILPSPDPRSSINPSNIGSTCSKCHPNAGEQLAKGSVHVRPSINRDKIIYYVTFFYIALILLTIGGMIGHNLLDFIKKAQAHFEKAKTEGVYPRLNLCERIQHIVLLAVFIILVYTGFAHKYPKAFFSYPFSFAEWGPEL
ncbi:MAG: cytochrome B, partial [Deltaproteobacteria bacterium]|nr:cytochrome B [Deltaproteobacteria bacterium]